VKANGSKELPANVAPLRLFGQEINPATFAMARMNAFIHDMEADIELGDTMAAPKFTGPDGALRRFDLVTANQGSNKERDIRKACVEADLVEAVVLLPENLFYNTTATVFDQELTGAPDRHPGFIVLRLQRQAKPQQIAALQRILPLMTTTLLANRLWIVEETRVRVRGGEEP
jgi:hypothetical protein